MTIQFKKFLIGLLALGLGIATLALLVIFAMPENAELASLGLVILYFFSSIGSMFVYYFLLRRFILKQTQTSSILKDNVGMIVAGILLAAIQIIPQSLIAHYIFDIESRIGFGWISIAVNLLGFFFFPLILTRPISQLKKIILCIFYFVSPFILTFLLELYSNV